MYRHKMAKLFLEKQNLGGFSVKKPSMGRNIFSPEEFFGGVLNLSFLGGFSVINGYYSVLFSMGRKKFRWLAPAEFF